MPFAYPILGDIWPFAEAAAPPELASQPVDVFFGNPGNSSVTAAQWTLVTDPASAPRAGYTLRLTRSDGQGALARWNAASGTWETTSRFPVPDQDRACSIIELKGILLGNVSSTAALSDRLAGLLHEDRRQMKMYRLLAKVFSVLSIIVLFFSVRSGVETKAVEPFALIFAIAFGIGLVAVGLRTRCKTLSEEGMIRVREQFQFEYRAADHAPLTVNNLVGILKEDDRNREEEAVIFGFLLLLCFVYFISPLVVVGVIVALVIVTLMMGDRGMLRVLGVAFDRSETRLEQSFLSFRASNDALAPPALRMAKKEVLRDRIRRYGDLQAKVRETQSRFRLTQDIGMGVAFMIIFSSYAFPIAAGFQKLSISVSDSLVSTSLFSVAPVVVLLSISKSTVALAQIANRRLAALSR
ncbi:hypothetical protein QO034_05675 [Sedimentitalea sp. JM2-8]|uniref:ABC transmembrane type-1 domain-containing protein n=1 Tax=Sedimentitalea xiamensis TaxID=3050037 RepID=A0ABT7FBU7_9RHOB|nr:hypothetical protein [Sedimentitalea xiamensis]MDK3072592.1 hypothetical protein [Sedimentitalea xiamensis]